MSIFDLVDKKIAIKCKTEKDTRLVIDTAISYGLATNWDERDKTHARIYEYKSCYMFERSSRNGQYLMYFSGEEWSKIHGYELLTIEDIDELKDYEGVSPASKDVFSLFQ